MKPAIIAIDPGMAGGLAWYAPDGLAHARPMPDEIMALPGILEEIRAGRKVKVWLERTGTYIAGNSAVSAVLFARHCGFLEGLLAGMGFEVEQVAPVVWQGEIPKTKFPPLPKEQKERRAEMASRKQVHKKEIKEYVMRKFPGVKITLKTADALGILYYACSKEIKMELL